MSFEIFFLPFGTDMSIIISFVEIIFINFKHLSKSEDALKPVLILYNQIHFLSLIFL